MHDRIRSTVQTERASAPAAWIGPLVGAWIMLNAAGARAATFSDRTAPCIPGLSDSASAWGDYNRDGYVDLSDGAALWRNNGGTNFTSFAGFGGGLWLDYNNDGYLDFITYSVPCRVWRNLAGSNVFELAQSVAVPMPITVGSSGADYDGDGNVDVYLGGFEVQDVSYDPDCILYNQQGVSFTNLWQEPAPLKPARGVTACDFDEDGDMDVYVSNYRLEANYLWRNEGGTSMTDVAVAYGVAGDYDGWSWSYGHTIGSAWGDLDNDGHFDLFVGNFSHSDAWQDRPKFYRNLGAPGSWHFEDRSAAAGLAWQESYASPALGDCDNDGDLDLFFTTVYGGDHPVLYRNDGNWHFTDVTGAEGLGGLGPTYQAAWADIDNDGDLDLVADGKLFVNEGNSNHWLKVALEGAVAVNRAAIGAQVRIRLGNQILVRQVEAGTGQGNQNDLTLHFGLGTNQGPVEVAVYWPNGMTQTVSNVSLNQRLVQRLGDLPFALEVNSVYGTPAPPVGAHTNGYGTTLTNLVTSPDTRGWTQYVCTGWTLAGNAPATGATNQMTMVLTNNSTLTWNWTTQFFLATSAGVGGSVTPGGWYANAAAVSVTAFPASAQFLFGGWTGAVPAAHTNDNPLALTMDQARAVKACFRLTNMPHYVDGSSTNPPVWPYLSWATAATGIQEAVSAAWDGDSVLVKPGIYFLKDQISVTNGVRIRSMTDATNTILNGQFLSRCLYLTHTNALVEGFTITGGKQNAGAGVYCQSGLVQRCVITGNVSNAGGGGIYLRNAGLARNCLISNNRASLYGGGALTYSGGTIQNCTISSNVADNTGGGLYCNGGGTILNTIVYSNAAPAGTNWATAGTGMLYACSCAWPLMPGAGNLTNDPQFVAAGSCDYRLQPSSACIDAGTNLAAFGLTNDLAGSPRPLDGRNSGTNAFDLGAYEFLHPAADTDHDGMKDGDELASGTDLLDPRSFLGIDAIMTATTAAPAGVVIRWFSAQDKRYSLERSTNMPAFADTVRSNIPARLPMNTETDTTANGNWPYFYRVRLEP
jgi:hypothetical protein